MTVWVLWIVLVTGDRLEAGQYQSEERCFESAVMQKGYWLNHRPKPKRMHCEKKELWVPRG